MTNLDRDYDNEKVTAIVKSNTEENYWKEKEIHTFTCPECGKEISGTNRQRVEANAKTHVASQHGEIYGGDEQ